jgi:hypothetical protein
VAPTRTAKLRPVSTSSKETSLNPIKPKELKKNTKTKTTVASKKFKVALKSDDSSSKKKAQEKNDVVETSTAPPKKMSSSTINTKEIISKRKMENHLPSSGRSTARLNRSDTHSESSYFSDASNSDIDDELIIPDASSSSSPSDDEGFFIQQKPKSNRDVIIGQDEILLEDLEKNAESTEVSLKSQEDTIQQPIKVPLVDKTKQIEEKLESLKKTSSEPSIKPRPSVEELDMDHKSRLNMWESKLKEPQRTVTRSDRKSLDMLGGLAEKKKELFETQKPNLADELFERPATVASTSLADKKREMEVALSRSQSLKSRKISMSTEDFQRSVSMRRKWEKRIDKRRPDSDSDDDVIFKDPTPSSESESRNASNKALEWEQRFQDKQKEADKKPPPVRNMTLDSTELEDEPGLSNLTKSELDQLARELSLSDDDKLEKNAENNINEPTNEPSIISLEDDLNEPEESEEIAIENVEQVTFDESANEISSNIEEVKPEDEIVKMADNEDISEIASESMLIPDNFSDTSSRLNSFQSAGDELAIREALGDGITVLITPSPSQSMPLDSTTDHDTTNNTSNNSIEVTDIAKDEDQYQKVAQSLVAETLEESFGELKNQSESITEVTESLTESFTADSISISIQNQTSQEEAPTSLENDSVFAQSEDVISASRPINEEMNTPAELITPEDLKTPDFVSDVAAKDILKTPDNNLTSNEKVNEESDILTATSEP